MDRKTKPPDLFSQREELSVNLKNGKMMSKVLLYLLMITCMLTRVSSTEVKWKVLDTSPKLGQDLTLFCKVDNCTVHETRRWHGGPDNKPLMSDSGNSADKTKYNTSIEKNGLILTILNLTVKDLNVSYECSCGFGIDNHILYIEVYKVDNLNKSTNGTNYVGTINAGWGVIIGYIAIPVILVILLIIVIVIKRHWLWRKLEEKICCPRRRNTDLDDNLHGSQLLQHPQELINRVTVDRQSVTEPLVQPTPVDSNPRQSSDLDDNLHPQESINRVTDVDGQSVTDQLVQTTPVDSNPRLSSDEVDGQSVTDQLVQTTPVDSNPRQISGKLSDKVLSYVASKLGSEWTEVVLVLDITHSEIEQIQLDYPNQTTRQTTKALIKWRDSQHNGPQQDTIKQLIRALEFPGRRDIIDDLKENYGIY